MLEWIKQLLSHTKEPEPTVKDHLKGLAEYIQLTEGSLDRLMSKEAQSELAQAMIAPLIPNWKPAPEGTKCGACGSEKVERSFILAGGPFSGCIRCNECGNIESVGSAIFRSCIIVEPLIQTTAEADQQLLSQGGAIISSDVADSTVREVANADLAKAWDKADYYETRNAELEAQNTSLRKFVEIFVSPHCSCEYDMDSFWMYATDHTGGSQGQRTRHCLSCQAKAVLKDVDDVGR